jgi:hypothetical protein
MIVTRFNFIWMRNPNSITMKIIPYLVAMTPMDNYGRLKRKQQGI